MSLTDPTIARRARAARSQSQQTLVAIILWLPLTLAADALAAALFFGPLTGGARYLAASGLAESSMPAEWWHFVAGIIGVPASIIVGVILIARFARSIGAAPAALVRVALFWVVATVMLVVLRPTWLPLEPGTSAPFFDYLWTVTAALGALSIVLAIVVGRRARETPEASRVAVLGTVTAVEQLGVRREPVSLDVLESINRVTASYPDEQGTTRWAEKVGFFLPADVPEPGSRVQVHYDSRKPSDVRRMRFDLKWSRERGKPVTP